jgi:hypothetical protein
MINSWQRLLGSDYSKVAYIVYFEKTERACNEGISKLVWISHVHPQQISSQGQKLLAKCDNDCKYMIKATSCFGKDTNQHSTQGNELDHCFA